MLQTRYITVDDFNNYFQMNLEIALGTKDKAIGFIKRIEDRMEAFLNANFFKRVTDEYPCFTEWQKEKYKLALLEQAIYIFKNSDISVDSGYDPDSGIKASRHAIKELSIAPNAMDNLILCGLWTRHISKRYGLFNIGWWLNGY